MLNTVKKIIYPCNRKKNMKRIVILMAVLGLSMSNLQAMQLAVKSNDNETVMLDASKVPLFGTIKDVVEDAFSKTADGAIDYAAQSEPIPLGCISAAILKRLVRDADDAQANDDNSLSIESAKPLLDGAIYLGASISTKKYASAMAKRLVSDESMRSLHEDAAQHPALSLSEASRQMIDEYMPQIWGRFKTIEHYGSVYSVAFSPNSELLATGSGDNNARIINATTGAVLHKIKHGDWVCSVAFSPDGELLATGSGDKNARIIEAATGAVLHTIKHGDWVISVAFSPNGALLATGSGDNNARIIKATTGAVLHTIKHGDWVWSVAFSPDGELLATGSHDGLARIHACLTVENPLAVHYLRWCRKKGYACNEDEWITQALAEHRYKKALENMFPE